MDTLLQFLLKGWDPFVQPSVIKNNSIAVVPYSKLALIACQQVLKRKVQRWQAPLIPGVLVNAASAVCPFWGLIGATGSTWTVRLGNFFVKPACLPAQKGMVFFSNSPVWREVVLDARTRYNAQRWMGHTKHAILPVLLCVPCVSARDERCCLTFLSSSVLS